MHIPSHIISSMYLQNFFASLNELRSGKRLCELSQPQVPKTDEEAERIKKRGEKSKEVMFNDLKLGVEEARKDYPRDQYLKDMSDYLKSKNFKHFNPKSKLIQLVLEVEEHIDSLEFGIKCDVEAALEGSDGEDSSGEVDD